PRRDKPSGRVLPANERLHFLGVTRAEIHHRLVVDDKFLPVECTVQVRFDLLSPPRLIVHFRIVADLTGFAGAFRCIHCNVCLSHQIAWSLIGVVGEGDSDTRRDVDEMSVEEKWNSHLFDNSSGYAYRFILAVKVLQEDSKFIPANTSDGISLPHASGN